MISQDRIVMIWDDEFGSAIGELGSGTKIRNLTLKQGDKMWTVYLLERKCRREGSKNPT